jgi:hypothetical protein
MRTGDFIGGLSGNSHRHKGLSFRRKALTGYVQVVAIQQQFQLYADLRG